MTYTILQRLEFLPYLVKPFPSPSGSRNFSELIWAGRESDQYVLAPEKTNKGANKYRYDTSKPVRSHFVRCKVASSLHDMRRSFASNRASDGISIYKIAGWLGDGFEVVQRSYGHLAAQDAEIDIGV